MEQKFSNNCLDLEILREFCKREGEAVVYRRGDQLEREGDPARWLAFVTEGCFKYVTHGLSDDREHITWFSFEGEFVVDYPTFLYARPAQKPAFQPSAETRLPAQRRKPLSSPAQKPAFQPSAENRLPAQRALFSLGREQKRVR